MDDQVKSPDHYSPKYEGGLECIENIRLVWGDEKTRVFCEIAIFEYLYRYMDKNGIQDLEKIKAYCDIIIAILSGVSYEPEAPEHKDNSIAYRELCRDLYKTAKQLCEDRDSCKNCPLLVDKKQCVFACVQEPEICALKLAL